jgi:hypothetical protein
MKKIFAFVLFVLIASASLANDTIPVLLYHSRSVGPTCSADDTDVLAFERDVAALRESGYVIRPLIEVVYWQSGVWSRNQLPAKVAAVTFDDGFDRDWLSGIPSMVKYPNYPCRDLPSVREIAERDLIPVTFFVIASRSVRSLLQPDYMNDNWWLSADQHYLFDIGNHTVDHEHSAITQKLIDPAIPSALPAAGHADGRWVGDLNPRRWGNYASAHVAFAESAGYIRLVTGRWPQIIAHPMGYASNYAKSIYLPNYAGEHHAIAAFCTEDGTADRFVSRSSDPWCLPRISRGVSWRTAAEFSALIGSAK